MSKLGCLLVVLLASTQIARAQGDRRPEAAPGTATPGVVVPTVVIPASAPVAVPTVSIPPPSPTPRPTARPRHKHTASKPAAPRMTWIWAFLTSYCPGAAGWLSSSGMITFYGMLANNYYPFGTHVYLPVLGMTGVVEDRIGSDSTWNHFDVWSPVCYSTPTGWFKVAVIGR